MPNLGAFHPQVVHFVVSLLLIGVALRWLSVVVRKPFVNLAATLCLLNMLFAYIYLLESRVVVESTAERPRLPGRSWTAVMSVITHPRTPASRLIWIYAIGIGAFMGMNAILALYLARSF